MADQAERRVDDRAVQEVKNSGLELAKRVRKSNYPESKSLCEWAERARVVANGVSGTRGKDIANALEFLQSETASCLTALNDPQAFQPACMRGQVLALTRTQMGEMAARLAEAVSRVRNAADISRGRQEAMEEARKLASEAERRMAERFDEGLTSLGESIRQKSEEETDRVVQQLSKADKNIRQVVEGEAQDVRQTVEGEVRDTLTAAERAYSSAISSVASKEAMVAKTAERLASSKGQGDQGNKGCEKHQQKEQSNHPDPHPPTDPNPDPAPEPEPPKPKGKATAKAQPTGASVGTSEPQRGNQAEPFEFDDEEADGFAARPEAAGAPSTRQARRNGKTQSEQATQKGYGTGVGASTVGAKTAEEIARREATKSAHPRAAEMVNELLGKPLMNRRRNRRTTWEEAKARGWSEVDLSGMEVPGADITVRKRPEEKGLDPPLTRALASALTACACLERLSLSGCLLEDAGEAAVDDLLSSLASHSCLHCIAFGGALFLLHSFFFLALTFSFFVVVHRVRQLLTDARQGGGYSR